jgi:hypothetical protein
MSSVLALSSRLCQFLVKHGVCFARGVAKRGKLR